MTSLRKVDFSLVLQKCKGSSPPRRETLPITSLSALYPKPVARSCPTFNSEMLAASKFKRQTEMKDRRNYWKRCEGILRTVHVDTKEQKHCHLCMKA
ncbi:hypothetical protein CDAR_373581 [Caerostris darwini]|uniref:Uncharacterized protein n=1 Tax=Caerostris darwini TaxID=1538125 RepID=A0AAV4QHX4_9ARAC|nr:hypothetical protein CDAR_373581 [Caerostris darwini]